MRLVVNQTSEIISYVKVGTIEDAIEFGGTIPECFEENFKPSFYLLQNDLIILNPNYVPPKPPVVGPGNLDKAIAQLTLQTAQQKANQDKLNAQVLLEIAQLKGGNN
ncbi:hypothetical protein [Latilactobacillus phage TMW 1.46 P2]|nr:DUF2977 domain-containing protein [Latilactobacillus sakei subsp. sakei]USF96406.1 hypothetical protein A4W82_06095 [Latilactobacillus sakei]WAX23968.1 hypothetical protein [Latilactobacillus phage TMW 1.46 P2]